MYDVTVYCATQNDSCNKMNAERKVYMFTNVLRLKQVKGSPE